MRRFKILIYRILLLFCFLAVLFVPFSFNYTSIQSKITKFLFEDLISFIASHFKSINIVNPEISSDSTTLYLLFFILFILAVILITFFSFFNFWKKHRGIIIKAIQLVLTYYLACIMLKYGFDKIFKVQFYLPEPNILYTPVGMLDKDILFWSTMGTSYSYNIFMGLIEVIPALMLLFNRTRNLGLFFLFGVLINVVFINFGFDISVKLYSLFLLLLCFLLLASNLQKIGQFFILNKAVVLNHLSGKDLILSRSIRIALKITVVAFLFFETLFPYIQKNQYNDDNVPRNLLHGAYEVVKIETENANQNGLNLDLKRIFIHRQNYFIFQYKDDTTEDFHLEINPSKHEFTLTNYDGKIIKLQYQYSKESKVLQLQSSELGIKIYSKVLAWKNLPLLQPLFHWTVDEI